jgi:hypothetical protein
MKRIVIPVVVVAAFALGVIAGSHVGRRHDQGRSIETVASYEVVEAKDTLEALLDLRAGNTNAVFDSLERDLSSSVEVLHAIEHDFPTNEYAEHCTNLLRRIAEYRSTHPYHSNVAETDAAVAEILSQIKK